MSRLLTLPLLYRSGYIVGKYISIEMLIAKGLGKTDRVRAVIENKVGKITKSAGIISAPALRRMSMLRYNTPLFVFDLVFALSGVLLWIF